LGAVGAGVFHVSYALGYFSPSAIVWGLFFLVLEAFFMGILGTVVAGVVIAARLLLSNQASRLVRGVFTGVVALICSGASVFAVFGFFPVLTANPWAVAAVTGVIVGSAFAAVSHWHTSEF
jgi:hypothetical protein